jgi:small-conductance mechanosensitive channel
MKTLRRLTEMVIAGLALALQSLITAFAGHLVILRGKTFSVGDRITMGGIRETPLHSLFCRQ